MQCKESGCKGDVVDGRCKDCGAGASSYGHEHQKDPTVQTAQVVTQELRALLDPKAVEPSIEDLLRASDTLKTIVPDNYEAWRVQADLLLSAIRQLETRQLEPDDGVTLMGILLQEVELRDAAERALRQCAHFAATLEQRISLIDEANSVRNTTWF